RTGKRILSLAGPVPTQRYRFQPFDPTGRWIATGGKPDEEIRIWEAQTGKAVRRLTLPVPPPRPLEGVRLHPGGDPLAVLANPTLYLWDVTANRPVRVIERPGHFSAVTAVAQHTSARLIASGGAKGSILLWDRHGTFRANLLGHGGAVAALAFSPDGTGLASASADGT